MVWIQCAKYITQTYHLAAPTTAMKRTDGRFDVNLHLETPGLVLLTAHCTRCVGGEGGLWSTSVTVTPSVLSLLSCLHVLNSKTVY